MITTQKLRSNLERQLELVDELQRSLSILKCKYHLVIMPDSRINYALIDLKDNKIVADGSAKRIMSWLKIRNIHTSHVFEYDQLEKRLKVDRNSHQRKRASQVDQKNFFKNN